MSQNSTSSNPLRNLLSAIDADNDGDAERSALSIANKGDESLASMQVLLLHPDANHRWWAARTLAAIGTPRAVSCLIDVLEDPDPDVRACVVVGLVELQPTAAIEPLICRLADPSAYVARLAADGLAQFGATAAPELIAALEQGDALTRIGAARALSAIQPKEAIPALIAALDDPSAAVTAYAEDALAKMGVGMIYFKP